MREKPKKPERRQIRRDKDLDDMNSKQFAAAVETGDIPGNARFAEHECYGCDEFFYPYVYWYEDESDFEYERRLAKYHFELREYELWREEHKEDVAKLEAEMKEKEARNQMLLEIAEKEELKRLLKKYGEENGCT